jgi:CheY-like chemotaxis protein
MKDGSNGAEHASDNGTAVRQQKLVLLVDDEVDITTMYAVLLPLYGFRAITASGAPEALHLLETERPDVIVSDCMMPIMDGVAFCAEVRSMPEYQHIHFVLMSGAPERHFLETPNYDVFLRKPFPFELLVDVLVRLTTTPDPTI